MSGSDKPYRRFRARGGSDDGDDGLNELRRLTREQEDAGAERPALGVDGQRHPDQPREGHAGDLGGHHDGDPDRHRATEAVSHHDDPLGAVSDRPAAAQ